MNQKAIINGQEYTLLEILPSLDGGQPLILCEDENGKRAVCSEPLWRSSALPDVHSAPVHAQSSSQEKIEYFLSVFKGREDVYARRYHSTTTGKTGYTPVCKNEWAPGLCDKKKFRCAECPNRAFQPLTAAVAKAHLIGRDPLCRDVAAIYPMLEDNTTWLLAADFDEKDWRLDVTAFRKTCKEAGLEPAVERSRSGNGAHVWFFFSEPVSAAGARRLGTGLLTLTMSRRHELSFSSYDRLFPSQDVMPKGGFGNLIALPFQGQAQKDGNSLFVDDGFVPYPDQWAYLSSLPKITPEQLEDCLEKLCRNGDMGELADAGEKQAPWKRRHAQTKLTRGDFPLQVVLHLSNFIYIAKNGFSHAALNTIKRFAAFPNPEFRAKQAMRLSVYGIPRVLDCGYEDEKYIGIPRGCQEALLAFFDQYEVPAILEDHRSPGHPINVEFNGVLRPEQEPAVQALLASDMGVLSAATAFGKTVIGACLIGQRKVNTLVLVQSSALLEQWKTSLEQFLNLHEALPELPKKRGRKKSRQLIGQFGSGKNTRSGIVDVATMQSLFEGEEKTVKPFVAEYGMVIVDECHHVAAFTFETVLKAVAAKYVYGLSATPVRKDGHHPIIFMQCGPVRYLVDAKSQAEKRSFSHVVIPRFTRMRLPNAGGIQDLYAGVVENHNRNELLVSDTVKLIQEGRTPLLLTERKEHAALLADHLSGKVRHVFLLVGSEKQKEKREKLAALQNVPDDEEVTVVATGKYIGEGFDSPRLDTLLLAMPISWKGTLAQYAGRLHRTYEGKREVRIYDYVDLHVPTLERMYQKRLKGYAELGYQVKFGAADRAVSTLYDGHASMQPFEQDLEYAVRSALIVSPYLQKGRVRMLLPSLQKAIASGVKIIVHTRSADSREPSNQHHVHEAIALMEQAGVEVHPHKDLNQRYAVVDESIVWYGAVDFLVFGRKETDVLRFKNPDIAGEFLSLSGHAESEQLVMEDVSM
ncbi:MAG: DEAD/DEAH box helicase family protein [Firmicutes bacterium]|nr:DEAD/DEAH box helicase family protein [Bacillota bacterium]